MSTMWTVAIYYTGLPAATAADARSLRRRSRLPPPSSRQHRNLQKAPFFGAARDKIKRHHSKDTFERCHANFRYDQRPQPRTCSRTISSIFSRVSPRFIDSPDMSVLRDEPKAGETIRREDPRKVVVPLSNATGKRRLKMRAE